MIIHDELHLMGNDAILVILKEFDSRRVIGVFFSVYLILLAALWPWDRHSLYQKLVLGNFLRCKARPACKADNFTSTDFLENVGSLTFHNLHVPPWSVARMALPFSK
jgi:hypothetical protein